MDASPAIGSHPLDERLHASSWERLTELTPQIRTFPAEPTWASPELEAKFTEFVAGTFFKAMLEAMRKTVGKPTIVDGGRAEEIFRSQLDDTLSTRLARNGGNGLSDKLYRQFLLEHQTNGGTTNTRDSSSDAYKSPDSDAVGQARDVTL